MHFDIYFRFHRSLDNVWKITWENGAFYGAKEIVSLIRAIFSTYKNKYISLSPTGPFFRGDHEKNPLAVVHICQNEFYEVRIKGNYPQIGEYNDKVIY